MTGHLDDEALERLEQRVGRILSIGVRASSLCFAVGLAAALAGAAAALTDPVLTFGLLALLSTPALRVVVSVVAYTRSRDWLFAGLTLIVLAELALSVSTALHTRGFVTHILQR
jgi:uncharacterized membrane protein